MDYVSLRIMIVCRNALDRVAFMIIWHWGNERSSKLHLLRVLWKLPSHWHKILLLFVFFFSWIDDENCNGWRQGCTLRVVGLFHWSGLWRPPSTHGRSPSSGCSLQPCRRLSDLGVRLRLRPRCRPPCGEGCGSRGQKVFSASRKGQEAGQSRPNAGQLWKEETDVKAESQSTKKDDCQQGQLKCQETHQPNVSQNISLKKVIGVR